MYVSYILSNLILTLTYKVIIFMFFMFRDFAISVHEPKYALIHIFFILTYFF